MTAIPPITPPTMAPMLLLPLVLPVAAAEPKESVDVGFGSMMVVMLGIERVGADDRVAGDDGEEEEGVVVSVVIGAT